MKISLQRLILCSAFVLALNAGAGTCTWTGASANAYWDDGANWSNGVVPEAGDDVVINKNVKNLKITITNSTPVLKSLTFAESYACTLVTTNWNTCIRAESITIGQKGILTCAANLDLVDTNDMSRVFISCADLTIASGGKIDVDGKGYDMTPAASTAKGLGPGAGSGVTTSIFDHYGASHGGYGGTWRGYGTLPYDNPEAPVYPGSSGGQSRWGNKVSGGGGAVRIIATGTVTVNGSILASAENSEKYNGTGTGGNDNTSGSGGSIFIETSVFKGLNGVLRADGGSSACPTNNNTGRVGGGGMIAVHYDTSLQQVGDVSGMTISAAPGIYKRKNWTLPLVSNDLYRSEGGLGTLWFSDEKLLESLGTGITGRLENMPNLTLDSLVMTAGHVAFPKEGGHLTVLGDLVVSGSVARLEIGGDVATNHHGNVTLWSGKTPCRLTVGGDLRVIDGARVDVRSAETNAVLGTVGALVNVAGAMEVTGGASVYCWSDVLNGGSPRFVVGSLHVGAGSCFTANNRGYIGYFALWGITGAAAYGPGVGKNESSSTAISFSSGGGHGGVGGGRANKSGGKTYDDPYYPALPGSAGASSSNWTYHSGNGGGVVDVRAAGAIVIDGEVSADGGKADEITSRGGIGSGAGGTVFLYGDTVESSVGSLISAKGGDEHESSTTSAYVGGGGGRISIWAGVTMSTEGVRSSRITRGSDPVEFGSPRISLAGTVTAAGGVATTVWSENWSSSGGNGTIWLTSIEPPPGLYLLFR